LLAFHATYFVRLSDINIFLHYKIFVVFGNKLIFYGEELLAPRPTPQTAGQPLVGCTRLLIQYICSYPPKPEDVSSIRNLRTRLVVVTKDPAQNQQENIHFSMEKGITIMN
jgi:hypothetical protein